MCSPIGHTLAGYTIYLGFPQSTWKSWKLLIPVVLVANLPDIDIVLGFFNGYPNQFHRYGSHSLFFALFISFVVWVAGYLFCRKQAVKLALLALSILMAHLVFDYFGQDTTEPYGIPLLWPLSNRFYMASTPIFRSVYKSQVSQDFISSLFSRHNLFTMLWEAALIGPLCFIAWFFKRKKSIFKHANDSRQTSSLGCDSSL